MAQAHRRRRCRRRSGTSRRTAPVRRSGDPIEIAGLTQAFRAATSASGFCAIGSVKPNLGHLDIACGRHGSDQGRARPGAPPDSAEPALREPNPEIDFANSPFYVAPTLERLDTGGTPRRAGVSAFGVGRHQRPRGAGRSAGGAGDLGPPRPEQILVPLRPDARRRWKRPRASSCEHLDDDREASTGRRRVHAAGRPAGFSPSPDASSATGVRRRSASSPRKAPERVVTTASPSGARRPVAFLFPGQGSQHVGMGREVLRDREPDSAQELDRVRRRFWRPLSGVDLLDVLYPARERRPQADEQLHETRMAQPSALRRRVRAGAGCGKVGSRARARCSGTAWASTSRRAWREFFPRKTRCVCSSARPD